MTFKATVRVSPGLSSPKVHVGASEPSMAGGFASTSSSPAGMLASVITLRTADLLVFCTTRSMSHSWPTLNSPRRTHCTVTPGDCGPESAAVVADPVPENASADRVAETAFTGTDLAGTGFVATGFSAGAFRTGAFRTGAFNELSCAAGLAIAAAFREAGADFSRASAFSPSSPDATCSLNSGGISTDFFELEDFSR